MAHDFVLRFKLIDANGETVGKSYDLDGYLGVDFAASFAEAHSDAVNIAQSLDNVSGAKIAEMSLTAKMETDNIFNTFKNTPVDGSDVTEEVKLTVALEANDAQKTATMRVPSPVVAVFQGATGQARHLVNINHALLSTFVQQFSGSVGGHPTVSDGEIVDTDQGVEGILSAIWTVRGRERSR